MSDVGTPFDITVTYLEMTSPPTSVHPTTPAMKIALMRAEQPTLRFYRFLYDGVGEDWLWWLRRGLDDEALAEIIHDERVEIYVLYVAGQPSGFAELDRRGGTDIDLAYFGLLPDFIGRGLGRYFLRWAVDQAWSYEPTRLTVNTCTLDHPEALAVYQRAGFTPYEREVQTITDPTLWAHFPDATERAEYLQRGS